MIPGRTRSPGGGPGTDLYLTQDGLQRLRR